MNDLGGVWRTVGGRRIFIKDGEDLTTAMKRSGKFNSTKGLTNAGKEKLKELENDEKFQKEFNEFLEDSQKTPEVLNNRKNLVDYFKIQADIDLEKCATERQFAPRRGLNIDSRKLDKNEFFTLRTILNKKNIQINENGVYDYFITYEKKK